MPHLYSAMSVEEFLTGSYRVREFLTLLLALLFTEFYQNTVSIISHCAIRALSKNSARYDVTLYVTMF